MATLLQEIDILLTKGVIEKVTQNIHECFYSNKFKTSQRVPPHIALQNGHNEKLF